MGVRNIRQTPRVAPAAAPAHANSVGAAAGGGSDTHDGYHYITLDASGSAAATHAQGVANHLTMNVKSEKLFIYNPDANAAGAFEVFAELTHIPTGSWTLTGTGISSPIGT